MTDWAYLRDMEESEEIQEVRAVAQAQFVSLSADHVRLEDKLKTVTEERDRYRSAYQSARTRAQEHGMLLREE